MKKELDSAEEALVFIAGLIEEQKWLILPAVEKDGKFTVEWIEHKQYTSIDGKEYPDEVWVTKEGVPMLVQDMSEAHVRNTLRMLLRNQRMVSEGLANMAKLFGALAAAETDNDEPLPDLDQIPYETGNAADDATVRSLKDILSGFDHPDMSIPVTAVKGPTTLQ